MNFFKLFVILSIKSFADCALKDLYHSMETRMAVYNTLSSVYAKRFEKLVNETENYIPYIRCLANYFEKDMKDWFIDQGVKLDTVE